MTIAVAPKKPKAGPAEPVLDLDLEDLPPEARDVLAAAEPVRPAKPKPEVYRQETAEEILRQFDVPTGQTIGADDDADEGDLPVIKGGRVVYIGHARNKSVCYQGRLLVTTFEEDGRTDETKAAIPDQNTSYDFATHDVRGRQIRTHRMPMHESMGEIAGKRFTVCEHPEHLRLFRSSKDGNGQREFRIIVPKPQKARWETYLQNREFQLGRNQTLLKKTFRDGKE